MTSPAITQITAYGNAPSGDHKALFVSARTVPYPLGRRLICSFLILDADGVEPLLNNMGDNYYAVAVCNVPKGNNPKSKPFKIRKAMLLHDEYDPIGVATGLPDWNHFSYDSDKPMRVIGVRVESRGDLESPISFVTHIKRPRDGEWETIEGEFEGTYRRVNVRQLLADKLAQCSQAKLIDYQGADFKYVDLRQPWIDEDGCLLTLDVQQLSQLNDMLQDDYKKVRRFAESGELWVLKRRVF